MTATRNTTEILIVEDHPDTRGYLEKLLVVNGFTAQAAPNRDAAARVLTQKRVDVILLDYFMTGMSAFEFISFVRSTQPQARIILMTGSGYANTASKMLGVPEVITKPLSDEKVLPLLSR